MDQAESNQLKSLAGRDLHEYLKTEFEKLKRLELISDFKERINFNHKGYTYKKQYLANFVVQTLDQKYIIINSSHSFRHDRFKTQAYDLNGILNNSGISDDIIATVALYPDSELEKSSFKGFRKKVSDGEVYSPASHLFTLSEFVTFIDYHKASVEIELSEDEEEIETTVQGQTSEAGSVHGKAGNAKEKEIVSLLNNTSHTSNYKANNTVPEAFEKIVTQVCTNKQLNRADIVTISATDTVEKLKSGGNAKTDIVVKIMDSFGVTHIDTFSIKKTSRTKVSCHDYKADDFIRVLGIEEKRVADYFKVFQKYPTYSSFEQNLTQGYSTNDFETLLEPYRTKLTEWALTGDHDEYNLINKEVQVAKNVLIFNGNQIICSLYQDYIGKLLVNGPLKYGIPFSWTYPSKKKGKRIQLKMPIVN